MPIWNGETWDCNSCKWTNADIRKRCRNCGTVRGQFGHHPDPVIDSQVEIQRLQGLCFDIRAGVAKPEEAFDPRANDHANCG